VNTRPKSTPAADSHFEECLLDELKALVERGEVPPSATAAPRPDRRRGRRIAYGLAASVATAAVLGVAASALTGETARASAYTVVRQPDGSVRFAINEFRDPQGLEARLRQLGVNARIDYVPAGMKCRDGRFADYPVSEDTLQAIVHWLDGPTDRLMTDQEIAYYRRNWQEVRPELMPPGTTLVLTQTIWEDPRDPEVGGSVGTTHLAAGPVAPCQLVPDPAAPRFSSEDGRPRIELPQPRG
jgi:hypothetical protein